MKPQYRETFNDGYLQYGFKKTSRSESGKRTGEVFTREGTLAFKEMSIRESDYQMAGALGVKLDRKVKTMYPPSFKNMNKTRMKIIIAGTEHDVVRVDWDSGNHFLFFYLQEAGKNSE